MESGSNDGSLPYQCGFPGILGKNFKARSNTVNDRAANEDHFHGPGFKFGSAKETIACELAALRVAQNGHVEDAERFLRRIFYVSRKQDCPCAGAENRMVVRSKFLYSVEQAFFLQKLQLRGGFPARKNQRVALFEIGDGADFHRLRTKRLKQRGVRGKVTLDGEDSDFELFHVCHSFVPDVCGPRGCSGRSFAIFASRAFAGRPVIFVSL